jgi:ABC-type glycerol-3-phosphate transport system substrate-binding protein
MKQTKKLSNKFLITMACGLMSALLVGCAGIGPVYIPGNADTYDLDVTIDTRGTTISMWTGFGSQINTVMEELLDEFEQKTGIKVDYESKGGYPNLLKAINLASTSGSFPNIANGYPDHFASYIKSNILLRLDGLIENDGKRGDTEGAYTQNGVRYGSDGIMLMDYDDFYSDYTRENETLEYKEDGTPYTLGVPFNKSTEVLVYNATFFQWAASREDLRNKIFVPVTWTDVKNVGVEIINLLKPGFKTPTADGKILGSNNKWYTTTAEALAEQASIIMNLTSVDEASFRPFSYDSTANMFITLVRQYGAQFTEIDKNRAGHGYVTFNDAENKTKTTEAMTMLKDLFDSKVMGIPSVWNELYSSSPFKAYKSVMNISSTGGLSNITSAAIPVKAAPIPVKDSNQKYVISQGTSLGLFNKGTPAQRVAAWKLMIFLSQQKNGYFTSQTGYFPTGPFSYNSEDYQLYLESDMQSNTEVLQLECANLNNEIYAGADTGWTKFVDPGFRGSADIRDLVDTIPGLLMVGEPYRTVEEVLNAIYNSLSDYFKPTK